MPGGYGIFGTPWGSGGTGAGASVAQTSGSFGGYGHDEGPGWGGSNQVADAVNEFKANPTPENQQKAVNAIASQQYLAGAGGDLTAAQQADIMEGYPSEEVAASVQSGVAGITQGIQSQIDAQNEAAAAAEAERIRLANQKKTGIFGIDFGNLSMPSFPSPMGMITNVLQATQGKDRVFKKLAAGEALTPEDKIVLANLIAANKKNPKVLGDLSKYLEEYDVSEEYLRGRLDKEKEAFEGESLENIESLIEDYLAGEPKGLDSFTSMFGDLTGSADKKWNVSEEGEWSPTLEQLKKQIKPEGMAYLKANRPDLYYSFIDPQTTGSLEELANLHVTKEMQGENPDLVRKIFEARQTLGTEKKEQEQAGQGGGAGIPSLPQVQSTDIPMMEDKMGITTNPYNLPDAYSDFYTSDFNIPGEGLGVITPITLPDGTTVNMPDTHTANQFQQYLNSLTQAQTPATTLATTPTPFDYSRWPQFGPAGGPVPNYVNQGLGQGPHFDYWNSIANTFPGMR